MANVVVVGSQWGDEGKGKIVDWLSERADIVVRFQGGHNAGHTLVVDGQTYKLSLLPSGIVRGKLSVIGNGVVIDPWALDSEITAIAELGVTISRDNLRIAENATLILPMHRELDALREQAAGAGQIGTTKRGIGPAYEDKVGRRAIHAVDLANLKTLPAKVDRALVHHNALRRGLSQPEIDRDELLQQLYRHRAEDRALHRYRLATARPAQARGQTHPCSKARKARSSTSITAPIRSSPPRTRWRRRQRPARGLGPSSINYVLGITKAYTTRVGGGPFPTELHDEAGRLLGERGREFGTVTGRARRCGWFDACLVRQTSKISGMDGIALTKLDVLDGFDEVKVCVGYRLNGQELDHLPGGPRRAGRRFSPFTKC